MRVRGLRLALLLVVGSWTSACISIEDQGIPHDAPVLLQPEARALRGISRDQLVVTTDRTVERVPLDTQLVRRASEGVKPAVVSIYTKTRTPVRVHLFPIRLPGTSIRVRLPGESLGSGFFIHPSGYVLTNNHVIRDADEIRGLTRAGEELELRLLARDPAYDLALLEVRNVKGPFPALSMGDSGAVGVGDMTIAIGNPLGLGHTVTLGIISQTGRNLSGVAAAEGRHISFIQTDAAVNPGNSGGPLITLTGAWVGVVTAGAREAQGLNFAVPARQALEFLDDVIAGRGEPDLE